MGARMISVHQVLRYAQGANRTDVQIDGYPNYHFVTSRPGDTESSKLMLERGINPAALINAGGGVRRPVIGIRSSPWKAGHESNPWHDEFDLDHGHVRYYGDHKVTTVGLPGATSGNQALLEAWPLHAATTAEERRQAPPLLVYRSVTVNRAGKSIVKGHVEFCGVAVIERIEHVVQRDPQTGGSFPNLVLDLAVLDLAKSGDALDMRWIDDRRDASLDIHQTERHAPEAWKVWVKNGHGAIPRVRRRVLSSRVKTTEDQTPAAGSAEESTLKQLYEFFDGRKHAFELLAARVSAQILGSSGARYDHGWLTRPGGDGGVDFVGRLDVGTPASSTPLVVLGQAKCVTPSTSISPDQVARVVARLRRGWIGVFVTTGTFSRQAQVEVHEDQYPLVLVDGKTLAEQVLRMAAADHGGDVGAVLESVAEEFKDSITSRRPEEILHSA